MRNWHVCSRADRRPGMERVKNQRLAGFLRGIERVGGFGGKSDLLASNQIYLGSPDAYKASLKRIEAATARRLQSGGKTVAVAMGSMSSKSIRTRNTRRPPRASGSLQAAGSGRVAGIAASQASAFHARQRHEGNPGGTPRNSDREFLAGAGCGLCRGPDRRARNGPGNRGPADRRHQYSYGTANQ